MSPLSSCSWSRLFMYLCLSFRLLTSTRAVQPPKINMAAVPEAGSKDNVNVNDDDHVIIIGAGATGMCAAYTLEYLGVGYTVLEASDHYGGRVKRLGAGEFVDVPVDLGAEWISFTEEERARSTLNDLLLFDNQRFDGALIDYDPQTFSSFFSLPFSFLPPFFGNGDDGGNFQRRNSHNWIRFFYEQHKFYNATWHDYLRQQFWPYIADKVEFNAVVNSVNYSANNLVVVKTKDGRTFTGTKAIVAVPVTVMQDNDLGFDPPLPDYKRQALDSIVMPAGFKILMEFDEKFYPDVQLSVNLLRYVFAESPFYFDGLFGENSSSNMLTLLQVGGPGSLERAELSDDELVKEIVEELDCIFGDNLASRHFVKAYVQNWYKEPYIRGTYPESKIPCPIKNDLLYPLQDKIYFAGDYIPFDKGFQSYVHVAAISGRTAAVYLYTGKRPEGLK